MSDARMSELEGRVDTLHMAILAVLMQFMMRSEKPREALSSLKAFLLSHAPNQSAALTLCAELEDLVKLNERRKN